MQGEERICGCFLSCCLVGRERSRREKAQEEITGLETDHSFADYVLARLNTS